MLFKLKILEIVLENIPQPLFIRFKIYIALKCFIGFKCLDDLVLYNTRIFMEVLLNNFMSARKIIKLYLQ